MSRPKQEMPSGSKPSGSSPQTPRSPSRNADAPTGAAEPPAPGLNAEQHAALQRAAYQAEGLREALFPAYLASIVGQKNRFESQAFTIYLRRLIEAAGDPADPIERMFLEQIALVHFRIGDLHVSAVHAQGIEAERIYNSAAARLLGEFRRTALALRVYKASAPGGKEATRVRLKKLAQ